MEYTTVRNLVWTDSEKTTFNCNVFFVALNEEVPFTCCQDEVGRYEHVTSIWNRAIAGDFGSIGEFVPPFEVTPNQPQPTVEGAQSL